MTRSILLATTGESPQVVTETLFAIAQRGQAWPEAIWLITTSVGKSRACEGLLDAGHLARLCHELKKPQPAFNEHHVLVVPNAKGEPVDDARSLEDHQALGDFIMTQVRDLTAKNDIALHASLAGGRKTMTFYMGYAMSLFGRAQDTLSHVLISEGFEGLRDFWFPSQEQAPLTRRDGTACHAADAQVTLATIPYIRHRNNLPPVLLQAEGKQVHFSQLVELINLAETPEHLQLSIDIAQHQLVLSHGLSSRSISFTPHLLDFAFYVMLAEASLAEDGSIKRPSKGKPSRNLALRYCQTLLETLGLTVGEDLADCIALLDNWNDNASTSQIKANTFSTLKRGMATPGLISAKPPFLTC